MTQSHSLSEAYPAGLPRLSNSQWREEYDKYFTPNFGKRRLALVRGEGSHVWDAEGRRYLDFMTGISVNNLGHCHPKITAAIQQQAATLVHTTNLYYVPVQIQLGKLLIEHSFADRLFLGNSGAEANEAAIKIARRYNKETHGPSRHEIICTLGSFHGRTMATLTATGQEKTKMHFEPLLEGFKHVPYNDLGALKDAITPATGAIMFELIQGEPVVYPATQEYVRGIRELCNERGIIMIIDEVQTGLGRTGKLFAYEHYGITPDVLTLAKSIGGGLAMGAMLCTEKISTAFGPGAHGSTMGGNALTCAASLAYLTELIEGDWPAKAAQSGEYLRAALQKELGPTGKLKEIRGMGLMIGVDLTVPAASVVLAAEQLGLLTNAPAPNTLRVLPALNITREEIDEAVDILVRAVASVQ
ncbi:aspartate aminotransferase family protein [bacterium]|nr:aspartate aminotransferase family protein [bacterium]